MGLAGLYDDEAIFGVAAQRVADALRSGRLGAMPSGVLLYHGIVQSWMALPFIAWMPLPPALALRSAFVFFGAGAVVVLQRLTARALNSEAAGLLAATLLAVSPALIVGAHFGAFFNTTTVFFTATALWGLLRWLEDGDGLFFGAAALSIGLSLGAIAHAAVLFSTVIACMAYCLAFERRDRRAEALLCGGVFLPAGLAPLLWHLWRGAPRILGGIAKRTAGGAGWRPGDLLVMAGRLRGLLDGTGLLAVVAERPKVPVAFGNPMFPALFCGALAVLAYAGFRRSGGKGADAFAAVARVLVVLNLCYWTIGSLFVRFTDYFHFTNWQPIPQLTVAAAAYWIFVRAGPRSKAAAAAVFLLATSALADAVVLGRFYSYLERTKGEDRFSSAVYELSDWMKREDIRRPVALTWGVLYNLTYLSAGAVQVASGWETGRGDYSGDRMIGADMSAGKPVYLLQYARHQDLYVGGYRPEDTLDFLGAGGYACAPNRDFFGGRGELVLRVLRCERGGRTAARD